MKQNIYIGKTQDFLHKELSGFKKTMLVCDSSMPFLYINEYIKALPLITFNEFTPNPLYEQVAKGVEVFKETGCDSILAIGGGSTIDVAKCIKLYSKMNEDDLYLNQEYKDTKIPLIAIPTTAGTGSESTRYAVIYYKNKKQSVTHESIIPSGVILDATLIQTLPLYQKKCTLLDALSQGIESWWSVNSNEESVIFSKETIKHIIKNIYEYINHPTKQLCEEILIGANYGGRAINITQTTGAHAMSYKLTSLYGLPHGHAVALCLPDLWEYMIHNLDKCIDKRGGDYLKGVFEEIAKALDCQTVPHAINKYRQILTDLDIKKPLSKNRKEDIEILVNSVNPTRLANNPVKLDEEAIKNIYEKIVL